MKNPPRDSGIASTLAYLLSTSFGLGHVPWAPGTWGSAVGIFLYWGLAPASFWTQGVILLILSLLGVWSSGRTARRLGQKDPSRVIIDEVAGAYLALLGHPSSPGYLLAGFLLFRLLDIVKPWPVRQAEKLPSGWGIMGDDLVAGAITCLLLYLPSVL
ncbi:MAG TPA: phosphatidylglycerophosphatase A [Thermosulfurimonas dismutans]|uniref:Phosphatidylglycerophosphatase A n=1 Tax=Thermosulfurimonas dismutans TaxID=999894 RepID=A0A7C3GEY7_9BACT|nr:phosphatidylglycerophosphatase A [Thermosulfurimonas dismutans]